MKKAIVIIPEMYSIKDVIFSGLQAYGYKTTLIDYRKILRKNTLIAKAQTILFLERDKFARIQIKANKYYIEKFKKIRPELIIIYNDEVLLPQTLLYFRKSAKVVLLLGDNPLTLNPPNKYNVDLLFNVDRVVVADSAWKNQLERIGLKNVVYDYVAYNPDLFSAGENTAGCERAGDILFVGRSYGGAWGYKRCLFLKPFTTCGIDIFGTGAHWPKWFDMFPEIKKCMVRYSPRKFPFDEMNKLMHSYKIYPVDVNPEIVNGLHLRVFECIGAGILPLVEYTADIERVFPGIPIPVIQNYNESQDMALELIDNKPERNKILKMARDYLNENYAPAVVMNRILNME